MITCITLGRMIQKSISSGCSAHELTIYDELFHKKKHFPLTKKFHKKSILAKIFDFLPTLGYRFLDRVEIRSTTFSYSSWFALHFLLWVLGVFSWKNIVKKNILWRLLRNFYAAESKDRFFGHTKSFFWHKHPKKKLLLIMWATFFYIWLLTLPTKI